MKIGNFLESSRFHESPADDAIAAACFTHGGRNSGPLQDGSEESSAAGASCEAGCRVSGTMERPLQ
jgi:hypothetical protein